MALFSTLSRNLVALSSSMLARRSGWFMRAPLLWEHATLALYGPFAPQTQQRPEKAVETVLSGRLPSVERMASSPRRHHIAIWRS
jgi:hypothetical protein